MRELMLVLKAVADKNRMRILKCSSERACVFVSWLPYSTLSSRVFQNIL